MRSEVAAEHSVFPPRRLHTQATVVARMWMCVHDFVSALSAKCHAVWINNQLEAWEGAAGSHGD